MTTTAESTKGVPRIEADPAPTFRADHNALADWVRDSVGRSVPNAAARKALPKKWVGQLVADADTSLLWMCTNPASDGTWVLVGPQPACSLRKSGDQTLTNAAAAVTWNVEAADASGMHDNTNNPSRIIAPVAGLYEVSAMIFNSNTAGLGTCFARVNGTTNVVGSMDRRTADPVGALPLRMGFSTHLSAGDYIEVMALHATAVGAIVGGTIWEGSSTLTVKRVGP